MKQYIKSEQVCTARNHGKLCFDNVYWALRKYLNPFEKEDPLENIKNTWPCKHDITKAKGHDIINIGQQVNSSLQLCSLTRKQATVQANQTEQSEIVLSILKKKSEIK